MHVSGLVKRERIAWLDVARGLAIMLVVAGHVERGLVAANIAAGAAWHWLDYTIYSFHMPAFFLLSGITARMSLARKPAGEFLADKVWTIIYPYFLWSLIQGSVMIAISGQTNTHHDISSLYEIGWRPIGQFWFLYVLMIYQIVGAGLHNRRRVLLALSVCCYFAAVWTAPGIIHQILSYIIYYSAGFFDVVAAAERWRGRSGTIIPLSAGLFALATVFSGRLDGLDEASVLTLPSAVAGIVLLGFVGMAVQGRVKTLLGQLGAAAMTIYVLHVLFAAAARIILKDAHVPAPPSVYFLVCCAAGIALPYLLHWIMTRRNILAPLGLAPRRSRAPSPRPRRAF